MCVHTHITIEKIPYVLFGIKLSIRGSKYARLIYFMIPLFQPNDVAPAGGGVLTLEVVLNGIRKYLGLTLAVGTGVLLGADDDGFGAIAFVDAIDCFVKSFHLSDLLGGDLGKGLIRRQSDADRHADRAPDAVVNSFDQFHRITVF